MAASPNNRTGNPMQTWISMHDFLTIIQCQTYIHASGCEYPHLDCLSKTLEDVLVLRLRISLVFLPLSRQWTVMTLNGPCLLFESTFSPKFKVQLPKGCDECIAMRSGMMFGPQWPYTRRVSEGCPSTSKCERNCTITSTSFSRHV